MGECSTPNHTQTQLPNTGTLRTRDKRALAIIGTVIHGQSPAFFGHLGHIPKHPSNSRVTRVSTKQPGTRIPGDLNRPCLVNKNATNRGSAPQPNNIQQGNTKMINILHTIDYAVLYCIACVFVRVQRRQISHGNTESGFDARCLSLF